LAYLQKKRLIFCWWAMRLALTESLS